MIILGEVRQMFGGLRKLEDLETYHKALTQERSISPKQRAIIDEIYQRRKLEIEYKLPKRDKR